MKRKRTIKLLEDIRDNFLIYDDIKALDIAIRCVKKDKRSKDEFWKGYTLGFIVWFLIYILYHI